MRASIVLGIVIAVLAAGARVASAQPGNTAPSSWGPPPTAPPPSGPVPGEKSPGVALGLSLGGTVLSIALASADSGNSEGLSTIGGIGIWVAPSFGHWYAGKAWTPGMTARFAGAGLVMIGAVALLSCLDCNEDDSTGVVLVYAGASAFIGGVVYDIATAPGRARSYNARLRERAASTWAVAPIVKSDRAGLAITGRF